MHKKYRENLKNRPVKICVSCNKPIINPKYYKSNTHTTGIKGVRSKCQKERDNEYKRNLPKSMRQRKRIKYKKPKGVFSRYNIQEERDCLRCYKKFESQSLYNRICDKCKSQQEDIMNFSNMALETSSIDKLFNYSQY